MASRVLGVVPARLASTRLPEKPLQPLLGRPLVEWVWRRVEAMEVLDGAVIATDAERVASVCREIDAPVEMTAEDHPSGTDRVAEVARRPDYADFDVVVNIQGDEPLVDEAHLEAAVALVRDDGWDVGTCASPLESDDARRDPNVVKVVRAPDGRALYFSRAPVPYKRDGPPGKDELSGPPFLRHIGLYAYARAALEWWVSLEPSPLERLERLEQLRPLEAGVEIGVAVVGSAEPGVDTPADVDRVEARLSELYEPPYVRTGRR